MHQILFWLGLCPRPHWGRLQCLSRTTGRGPNSKGDGREEREKEGRGLRKDGTREGKGGEEM